MNYDMQKTISGFAAAAAAALALFSCAALAQSASADGEIRKVDIKGSRVIIKHGDWKGMDMQAMTMAFRLPDAAMLEGFKASDKVRFTIKKDGRDYVLTAIEHASTNSPNGAGHQHAVVYVHAPAEATDTRQ